MNTNLKNYFPMIRSREEILADIKMDVNLTYIWNKWNDEEQELFLNWCTGVRGVKILYDSFFKEIMNPEYTPNRMNALLSQLLKKKVRVRAILPTDNTRIADEQSLVIMDIIVELDDGSLADIEMQRIGYAFTGQRAACYSADLLLRQYKRIRGERGKKFKYNNIKSVYTIVFSETSEKGFKKYRDQYLHYFEQKSDTGMKLELLQKFIFIPLDIFKENYQNKGIQDELDAWLVFLSMDEPENIVKLITEYPEFRPLYEDVYQLCQNMERVMEMFSKELAILDRNTVIYMIDEMQKNIDEQARELDGLHQELGEKKQKLEGLGKKLEEKGKKLEEKGKELEEKDKELEEKDKELEEKGKELEEKGKELEEKDKKLEEKDVEIEEMKRLLAEREKEIKVLREKDL